MRRSEMRKDAERYYPILVALWFNDFTSLNKFLPALNTSFGEAA